MKILLWILGFGFTIWVSRSVDPLAYAGSRSRDPEQRLDRNRSAVAIMLGEFRTSLSDIMFIKTERYLHGGVAYEPHHSESVLTAADLADEVDEHQSELGIPDDDDDDDDHAGTPTLIPTPDRDFRGFVGRLHREVKPWRHPDLAHIHTDGRELIPWFRAMTVTDPQYIRGFVAGGFWLQAENPHAALEFVQEGLRLNPESFELYVSQGFLLLRDIRRIYGIIPENPEGETRTAMEEARASFARAAEFALQQRPPADQIDAEGFGPGGWGRYHEGDAMSAVHMTVSLTRMLGEVEASHELAKYFLTYFPDFKPLQNALDR